MPRSRIVLLACLAAAASAPPAPAVDGRLGLRGVQPQLAASFAPPPCAASPFADVAAGDPACPWIQQFAQDQISQGCGGGKFCPDDPVTRRQFAVAMEKAMRGTAAWDPWRGDYRRTIIVNPVLAGQPPMPDPAASGQRLLVLLAGIGDNAAGNPYLLRLEPGIFDLGGATLQLKPFVDVEGSGEGVSVIRSDVNGAAVAGADDVELRQLTIENHGGGNASVALELAGDSTRLLRVTAYATGGAGANHAIDSAGAGVVLVDVTAIATAPPGGSAIGVYLIGNALLQRVRADASGGAVGSGVVATAGSSVLEDVTIWAGGTSYARGVSLETGASATLRRVDALASSVAAGATAIGLNLLDGDATVQGGSFVGSATNGYGLLCDQLAGSHAVRVRNSRLAGPDHSIQGDAGYTIYAGDSQLAGGGAAANGAALTCFGTYDSNFANPNLDDCP